MKTYFLLTLAYIKIDISLEIFKSCSVVNELVFLCYSHVTGEPTVSKKPPTTQKWKKNKQTGGGAVIPCMWVLKVTKEFADRVEGIVRSHLPDVEGLETMEVQVSN